MQNKLSTIITAAYTPEESTKILAISADKDQMDPNWALWRQAANEQKTEVAIQNVEHIEQLIDAAGLLQYAREADIPVNAQTRADYANYLYEKQRSASILSADKSEQEEEPKTSAHSYTPPYALS